ncbi:MAG: nucleoside deaminase [Clostridiaceae bacterium]|jgi:tRNA(adenine34) deaminase|nr:tRNA adenosine(34) deaminase TadA [Oscillospiraceae bacterium]NLO62462.1 nucleoside deaminase [Clostridiaceae bacterium]
MRESSISEKFMRQALTQAKKAQNIGDCPIGCVVVRDGRIIARAYNLREHKQDATLHAEMIAIQKACKKIGSWRLEDCDLYVTLEPCSMCAGAIIQARVRHVYFGAPDPKAGAVMSKDKLFERAHNHRVNFTAGILKEECGDILSGFFRDLRTHKKSGPESTKSSSL